MAELDDEVDSLQKEYDWLLQEEVTLILEQLQNIILECSRRFPVTNTAFDTLIRSEKFLLTNTNAGSSDAIKAVVTLSGDSIMHADINLKIHKHVVPNHRTLVQNDCQWKLQQIQDAGNHLSIALQIFSSLPSATPKERLEFQSAEEVVHIVNNLMSCLQRGRACLIIPKRRTIDDILLSRNMKSLQPPLPSDIALSFYIQSHKLCFAVYHVLSKDPSEGIRFDKFHAESSVPWLSEALVLFTVSLQLCQQLKDKIAVFAQYKEMNVH